MTTKQLVDKFGVGKIKNKPIKIPSNRAIEFDDKYVEIDPYILGVIIGDGSISSGHLSVSTPEQYIINRFSKGGYILKNYGGIDYGITENGERKNNLRSYLRILGLYGKKSETKFVPKKYLFNGKNVRLEILKGLMDTDGYIDKTGNTIEYCSVSKQLAEDVQFLVRSFGGKATMTDSVSMFTYNNEKKHGQRRYRVFIKINMNIFSLPRKLNRQKIFKKTNDKVLREIIYIGKKKTTCIKTSAKNGLFIAKDFIVTHNTALMLNILKNNMHFFDTHYFNSEMGGSELRKRLELFPDVPIHQWKFWAYERASDFHHVLFPGKQTINVIDFLEQHEDFWLMGKQMRDIHDNLKGSIGIVCVQLNKGSEQGLGGSRTEEKPRLILNLSPGVLKIKMAKNWATNENPNGKTINFKLAQGCIFRPQGAWHEKK